MRIIIIGGSHAGIAAATRAKEEYPDADVVIYERQNTIGFIAQSIPYYLTDNPNFRKVSSYTTIQELENQGIQILTLHSVTDLDLENKTINFFDFITREQGTDHFDKLILAFGSYPSLPLVDGDFQDKLFIIKKFDDAVKIKEFMKTARSVIVLGGGAIGTEIARIMTDAGINTILVHSSPYILNRYLDREVAETVEEVLRKDGMIIHTSSVVTDIDEESYLTEDGDAKTISHVKTRDGRSYTADGIIYATGFRPNTFLVADKLELGDKGAIVVDDYMQTSHPDVFAVGDCSTTNITHIQKPSYIPHASDAIREGAIAAINLFEKKRPICKSQGTYKLNFVEGLTLAMTGLSKARAQQEGFDAKTSKIQEHYMNTDTYFDMWVVYEVGTHKILGMQCLGSAPDIAPLSDMMSLAIQADMTIEDLEYADFYFKHGYKNPRSFTQIIADKIREEEKQAN
jgi:NADPH-dependent 2,4-dienoyl-CoA reductase/sulfur reductase-like enzyme